MWLVCAAAHLILVSAAAAPADVARAQAPAWQVLNNGLPSRAVITSLTVDPRNEQRIFAGTTSAEGVWISDDGGLSGRFAGGLLAGRVAFAFSLDPARPDEILAGTDGGLFRSGDAGQTWERDITLPPTGIYTLVRGAGGAVLAGGDNAGIYLRAGRRTRKLAEARVTARRGGSGVARPGPERQHDPGRHG